MDKLTIFKIACAAACDKLNIGRLYDQVENIGGIIIVLGGTLVEARLEDVMAIEAVSLVLRGRHKSNPVQVNLDVDPEKGQALCYQVPVATLEHVSVFIPLDGSVMFCDF